jgi:hypothetical protein
MYIGSILLTHHLLSERRFLTSAPDGANPPTVSFDSDGVMTPFGSLQGIKWNETYSLSLLMTQPSTMLCNPMSNRGGRPVGR